MKPPPFEYTDPETVEGVVEALASRPDAVVLAGGQSLVMALNLRSASPGLLVDLRQVGGLADVSRAERRLTVGARTTATELLAHPATESVGALRRALGSVGHPQTRHRTTIGGTVALADPVAEVPTTLVTLGGAVHLLGPDGARSIDAAEWLAGPYATQRRRDELVTAVSFDIPAGPSTWREFVRRRGTFPIAGACVAIEHLDGDPAAEVVAARVGMCGAAEAPTRIAAAEAALVGRPLDPATIDAAVAAAVDSVAPPPHPHASSAHRRALLASTLRAALVDVAAVPSPTRADDDAPGEAA